MQSPIFSLTDKQKMSLIPLFSEKKPKAQGINLSKLHSLEES
jgi:hypothetical protein